MCDFQEAFLNFAFWFVVLTIIGAFIAARWTNVWKKCLAAVKESKFQNQKKCFLIKILQVHHNKAPSSLGCPTVRFASENMWLNTTERINLTFIGLPLILCQNRKEREISNVLCSSYFRFSNVALWPELSYYGGSPKEKEKMITLSPKGKGVSPAINFFLIFL